METKHVWFTNTLEYMSPSVDEHRDYRFTGTPCASIPWTGYGDWGGGGRLRVYLTASDKRTLVRGGPYLLFFEILLLQSIMTISVITDRNDIIVSGFRITITSFRNRVLYGK